MRVSIGYVVAIYHFANCHLPPIPAHPIFYTTQTYAQQILAYEVESDPSFVLSPDIALAIESLWKDPIIATVMDHSSEFYLMDSAS